MEQKCWETQLGQKRLWWCQIVTRVVILVAGGFHNEKNAYEIKQPRYLDEANDDLKGVGYLDAKILRSVQ